MGSESEDLSNLVNLLSISFLHSGDQDIASKPDELGNSSCDVIAGSELLYRNETTALEQFSFKYKSCRGFSQMRNQKYFHDIFTALVRNRMEVFNWQESCHHESILRVLTCLRLLMRDGAYHKVFVDLDGVQTLSEIFNAATESYVNGCESAVTISVLKEIMNIFDKLCVDDLTRNAVTQCGVHRHLVMLLFASDLGILQCSLQALLNLIQSSVVRGLVAELDSIEILLHILQDYDTTYKKSAAQLLRMVLAESKAKEMVKVFDGVPVLLSLLHSNSIALLWHIIWCLVLLSEDNEVRNEVRLMGGIPLLLSMLHDGKFSGEQTTPSAAMTSGSSKDQSDECSDRRLRLLSACCACLTELVVSDMNGQQTVQNNGIYLVGLLILPQSTSGDNSARRVAVFDLQAYAFRTLRFLFSMERNRRHFKRLLPPDLFESFIDIGHYNRNIEPYLALVDRFNGLPDDVMNEIRDNIEACDQNRAPSCYIGDYAILEQLGSGAFGIVYKVQRKSSAQSYFAMKEINTFGVSFGKTSKERQTSVGAIINELSIIREQLKHPNIVRYHKTFQQSDKLYIVMELIEGASLAEHFASLKEKNEQFTEERIWNIFFQLVLALRYLHKDKGIVHRDLTPNNIMLGENDKVTITDFGLAKQKQKDCSKMNSVVGTILYSCPEILKNEPYGEKADVWAIGCILYELCTLRAPFYSTNMLQLATKIVEAQYEPLREGEFSAKISSTIALCITPSHEQRADIVGVSSHVADLLLIYIDKVRRQKISLEKKLEREKRRTQKYYNDACCQMENYHRQFGLSAEHRRRMTMSLASSSGGSGDIKDESELSSPFVDETVSSSARCVCFHDNSDGSFGVAATPDCTTDDETVLNEDSGLLRAVLSHSGSAVIPHPPEGTPNSRRKPRNVEKSVHNLTVDVYNKVNGRDSGLGSGSPSPLRTPVSNGEETSLPSAAVGPSDSPQPVSSSAAIHQPTSLDPGRCPPRPKSFTGFQDIGSGLGRRSWTPGRARPCSAAAALTISPRKVRPVTGDPILQMLDQVHRIIFLTQLPPTLYRSPRRRAVECFRRVLFGAESNAVTLKNELHKLISQSRDVIDINLGLFDSEIKLARQVSKEQEAIAASNAKSGFDFDLELVGEDGITYEQMASIIETLLLESNYYANLSGQAAAGK